MSDDGFADALHDVWENRVRFEETDQQGVVFYGNYVTYQDETFNAFLRAVGYTYDDLERDGWDVHVVHVDLDYHAPARFEDDLVNAMRVTAINESSIELAYRCRRGSETLAEGGVVHVAVDESGASTRVPDAFRESVVAYQDEPPSPV